MPGDAIIESVPSCTESRKNMSKRKFWPLDFDLEGEIYENPAWDLPGFRRTHDLHGVRVPVKRAPKNQKPAAA